MDAFTNYIEKLGSNFLVSSMVPSLALVVTSLLVFDPSFVILAAFRDFGDIPRLIVLGLLISILTIIIGFTLTALNTFILKMFEGYVKPFPIRIAYYFGHRKHKKNALILMKKRDALEAEIRRLKTLTNIDGAYQAELERLLEQHYKLSADYGLAYPEDLSDVMPSRFGNTLKAAENYPGERYGFDGVQFWPRLVHVIPNEYKINIDNTRNELSFLVNMSILSALFSFLSILAIFFSMSTVDQAGADPRIYFKFLSENWKYFLFAALGIISCYFFYNASIFSVSAFGLVIRSSFDLFRLDLLKKLGVKKPRDSIEEFKIWNQLNELIVLGSHSFSYKQIEYFTSEDDQNSQ